MIYLSKYQRHQAPLVVETMESDPRDLERSCGGREEVVGKKNRLEKINLVKKEDRSFSATKQPFDRTNKFYQITLRKFAALISVFLLVLWAFLPGETFAATYVWTGATNTTWSTTTNWTPNGNPGQLLVIL